MSDHSKNRGRGDVGEEAVAQFLTDHRCTIAARNYISYGGGEIDIIAENEARILFVEVKSRQVSPEQFRYGRPSAAVTWDKQKRIISAARAYLTAHPTDKAVRFDVAEVFLTRSDPPAVLDINYIKGAFIKQKGRNSYD
ncbi:MAG: YraN family protein [Ruminococcaceae bacterium]|nr:YraN family protein [Oscillospiraceae bacterium]